MADNVAGLADAAWKKTMRSLPWYSRLSLSDKGSVKATLHNVVTILEEHEEWRGLFQYNEFSNQVIKSRVPVYGGGDGEFRDVDGGEIAAWLGDPDNFGVSVASKMAMEAVEVVAHRHQYHPVRTYLEALKWDGTDRLPNFFPDYFGAPCNEYTTALGVNALVAAVARVMRPGAKVDFMVVLEGAQGLKKTSSIQALFGDHWFAEMMDSPSHKDFYQVLQGRWAVEISEMNAFSKSDVTKVKQAITTQVDVYRPSYGRYAREFPRQCVFWGTTNEDAYLRDPTGARRFMPVRCAEIDLDLIRRQRDQLWAEAYARFHRNEAWWRFPDQAYSEQDDRYQADSWEEPILLWLAGEMPDTCYEDRLPRKLNQAGTTELMRWGLGIDVGKHTRQDQMRVGAIMRRLGWQRKLARIAGVRTWVYSRPGADEEEF